MNPQLTNYEQWQLEHHGDVLQTPMPGGETELSEEEMQRFAEWNNEMAERQLHEHEVNY